MAPRFANGWIDTPDATKPFRPFSRYMNCKVALGVCWRRARIGGRGIDLGRRRDVIGPADLAWCNGVPFSRDFGDIYHSVDGAGETGRVFIEPADLAGRAVRAARHGRTLRVGELGFGTGLNFAVVAALALKSGCRLHFISFDSRPVAANAFVGMARKRRSKLPIYQSLMDAYPPLLSGWHRRVLAEGRIWLSLYWGEAADGLGDLIGRQRQPVDAWLLDGFAPDRNPDLWRESLFRDLAQLSGPGTGVATFTAAGRVRRSLENCGFEMRRVDQRPHKRESLAGTFHRQGIARQPIPRQVAVAGAGVAGAAVARHLAEQGIAVNVFDPADTIASGASRIPAMLLHPRLLGEASSQSAWRAHSFAYSQPWVSRFPGFVESGVLQCRGPNMDGDKMRRIASAYATSGLLKLLNASAASAISGWAVAAEALHFPRAGSVDPVRFTRALLDHPRISLRLRQPAPLGLRPLVLACAGGVRGYAPAAYLETAEVHGQVDVVSLPQRPRLAVVGDRYLVPTGEGVVVGATFEHAPWPAGAATGRNLEPIRAFPYRWLAPVRATRTMASDRTPIIGALAQGLYVSTAHGAMGTVSAPLAGAMVASQLTGDFAPVDRDVETVVAPERFRQRQARRGYRMNASPT